MKGGFHQRAKFTARHLQEETERLSSPLQQLLVVQWKQDSIRPIFWIWNILLNLKSV